MYLQCRTWEQAEVRVGLFVLRNKWVPSRPEPTPELQAAPRVTHGSQRRGAAAALLAAGKPRVVWWWPCVVGLSSKHHQQPTMSPLQNP
jgi:hypothetical protein